MIDDKEIAELTAKALKIMAAGTVLSCAFTVAFAAFICFVALTARGVSWLLSMVMP